MMVTSRNPVYSALWFAAVVLSTSGLFLLAGAQFLAAGTVIVYAGAIIVTFLFVIMLAQIGRPGGLRPLGPEPGAATLTCFLLLWALMICLRRTGVRPGRRLSAQRQHAERIADAARTRSRPGGSQLRPRTTRREPLWITRCGRPRRSTPSRTRKKPATSPAWASRCTPTTCSPSSSPARCCSSP